jgi:hypothetical protein
LSKNKKEGLSKIYQELVKNKLSAGKKNIPLGAFRQVTVSIGNNEKYLCCYFGDILCAGEVGNGPPPL